MKKTLLLIPLFLISLLANAATININTGTTDALRKALASAANGDEIVMAAGTYVESNSDYIAFTGKSVTVRAATGANVILQPQVPIIISEGGKAILKNIKIDASELCTSGSYSHLMYASDNADNNRLILDGCEVYGYTVGKAIIASRSSNKLDSLIINNCKFYNHTTRSCVFLENTENKGLIITNSTFYNIATGTESFSAGVIDDRSSTAKVRVDHCTFYNVVAQNTDYAAVGKINITDGIVSNCIFMLPENVDGERAIRGLAQANNCLTYNYIKDSNWGIHSSSTKTNCINGKDPLFANAASGNFTIANDWTTMSLSPACCAATDGSDLGDPRWSNPTLPSTNFASPYVFLGTKALLSGSFALNGDNYIQSQNKAYDGVAVWKIHAERRSIIQVTLNIAAGNTSGHKYKVELFDSDNAIVGEALAEPADAWSAGDLVLSGLLEFPKAGDYKVKLSNQTNHSQTIIEGVTFTYIGGAVQNMPGTTDIDDAWFSSNGTRADSKITFPNGKHDVGWVKWNVAFASAGNYNVTVNVNNTDGHNFTVALYRSESDESPITVSEGGNQYSSGTPNAIALGAMTVPAGNYIMKVTDAVAWSDAELLSVTFAYEGGAVVNIPNNNIPRTEAILEGGATRDNDGLHFKNAQYVKWNIHATEGLYTFTAHCTSPSTDNYSNLMIKVKQGNTELYSYAPQYYYNQADNEIQSPAWLLDAGDYTLELSNPTSGNGYLTSLAATAASNMFILDDNKTDDGSIAAAAGETYKFLLKRSFTAGRYYTICIPVGSWNDELKLAFGADYELWKMTSAVQNGDAIDLNFEQINGQSFHAGWPYIIKPSVDVQNPVLYNEKTIANSTYNNTQSFDAADFIGTFYKSEIPAGENNLYLQNNNLYYSASSNTTIKGTRAWIRLTQQEGSAPARARIVLGGQVATDINLVNGELINGTVKTIENGQLILIRDGKKYNVMGTRLQ